MLHPCSNQKFVAGLSFVIALLLMSSKSALLLGQSNPQAPDMASGEQILVLKNGEMLVGKIEQDAGSLIVRVRQGSRLVISKNKAEFVCDSKSEAFWGKSARTRASDVRQQVDLYRWCLKHKLYEHAESQLNIVMNCDIPATELDSLSRQLTVLRASEARRKQRQVAQTLKAWQPETTDPMRRIPKPPETKPVQGELAADLIVDSQVQQTSYASPLDPAESESGFSKVAAIPDLKQSHRLDTVAPTAVDPYDASRFNAETDRRNEAANF